MKVFDWNHRKNQKLIEERGISFEDIVYYIDKGGLIDDLQHPNKERYPKQKVFVIDVDGYIYLVPYIESKDEIFLKTIIPSRKATKKYRGNEQ